MNILMLWILGILLYLGIGYRISIIDQSYQPNESPFLPFFGIFVWPFVLLVYLIRWLVIIMNEVGKGIQDKAIDVSNARYHKSLDNSMMEEVVTDEE